MALKKLRLLAPGVVALLASLAAPAFSAPCGDDASGFDSWVSDFRQDAAAQGISPSTISSALDGARYSKATIRLDRNQNVFKQSFEEFSGRMIPPRVKRAKSMMQKHAATLQRIESQFGVPGAVVIAIWGLETDFGAVKGDASTLSSLATLAYDCRRSDFFTGQLMDALRELRLCSDITGDRFAFFEEPLRLDQVHVVGGVVRQPKCRAMFKAFHQESEPVERCKSFRPADLSQAA